MGETTQSLRDITVRANELMRSVREMILNLPDNPNIDRIDDRTFIVNSSDFATSWSPEYHDFKSQHRVICQILERIPIDQVESVLMAAIKRGSIVYQRNSYRLHPGVVEQIKSIL